MRAAGILGATLALAAAGCALPDVGSRADEVIGGTRTPDGMFPGVGALLYDLGNGPETGCTGTLIAPTVVLTAAHCVDPQLGGDALVGFTLVHDTTVGVPPMTAVARKLAHEQFDISAEIEPGLGHFFDIGLVVLAAPITDVAPIYLPRPSDGPELLADADLTIVGYGRTTNANQDVGVMYDATTKLVSLNEFELQVSHGQDQPQNCHGDSGGPALTELNGHTRTVGVVSRSFDLQPTCLGGGVDTRVDAYLDWIWTQLPADVQLTVPCGSGLTDCGDDEGGCCSSSRRARAAPLALAGLVLASLFGRRRRRRP